MTVDMDEAPLSQDEFEAEKQNSQQCLALWRRRGLYSMAALVSSCLLVSLFLVGAPLHAYWDSIGICLLLLTMGLLHVFLYCMVAWSAAWRNLRDLIKGRLEDQF